MANKDMFGAQSFIEGRDGKLEIGRFYPCRSADEACKIAQDRVAVGRAKGAAAFVRRGSGEFDEGETITIATYGAVPPRVADALPF